MKKTLVLAVFMFIFPGLITYGAENEVLPRTETRVVVREHPRTGKPYVVITGSGSDGMDPFTGLRKMKKTSPPDYRMLDPKVKSGQILYDGPVSDRKKVYILAGSLAAIGTAGGAAIIAAAPAATGAGAAGGAGIYAGAGAAVAAGSAAGTVALTKTDPQKESFTHTSESRPA